MRVRVDNRHKEIGGRHRALTRYYVILERLRNTHLPKNKCYAGVLMCVDKESFIAWFMAGDFEGCSVDRIDPKENYVLSNMQLIPTKINCAKDKLKSRDGFCECYVCKEVKPMSDFTTDSRRLMTGKATICKSCDNKRHSIRRERRVVMLKAREAN